MGFEWILTPSKIIEPLNRNLVLANFAAACQGHLLKQTLTGDQTSQNFSWADGGTSRAGWAEDFTLSISPGQVYLCFHNATASQRQDALHLLTSCLRQAGIAGEFEEL